MWARLVAGDALSELDSKSNQQAGPGMAEARGGPWPPQARRVHYTGAARVAWEPGAHCLAEGYTRSIALHS